MYQVSDQYKIDIHKQIRNESYVEIAHVIPNVHATTATYSVGLFDNEVNEYFVSQIQSATLEPLGCILNGTTYLRGNPAIVGNNLSGEYASSIASTSAKVVTGHSFIIDVSGVTLLNKPTKLFMKFDTARLVRPTALTINMLNASSTVLATTNYTITDYTQALILPSVADGVITTLDRIQIVVTALNMPYEYVRFEKVILGIVNEFSDEDIISCDWNVGSNPLTFEIPKADFSFTFLDPDRLYHESNPNSLLTLIEENQQVGFRYGYQLDSGGIEWVVGGLYRTTGEVLTDDSGIPRVTIKSAHKSIIADDFVREIDGLLVSPNDEEVTINITNIIDLMNVMGVTATLSSTTTFATTYTVVDPNIDVKTYAQQMCNAHGLDWIIERTSPYTEEVILKEFSKLIRTSEHNYDTVSLFNGNVYDSDGIKLFQFNNDILFSPPNIKSVPKADGVDYARYNIDTNETERKPYPDPAVGTRLIKVDNPFVTTQGNPSTTTNPNTKFGEYIQDYYGEQKTYVLSNRGFVELDVGDIVQIFAEYFDADGESVLYDLKVQGMVVANNISYTGSLKGETTVIGWESIIAKYQ